MKKLLRVALAALLGLALMALTLWLGAMWVVRADPATVAAPRYVAPPPTGNDAGNDCANSASPCATVQRAVDVAGTGDEIRIAGGIYAPGGTVAKIAEELALRGGYAPDFGGHDPDMYQTVLDAGWSGSVISITNAGNVSLEFLVLIHGDGMGNCGSEGCGGGVYATDTELHVGHCRVTENVGSSTGVGKGGGLYVYNGLGSTEVVHIFENQIVDNVASTAGNGYGGGLFLHTPNAAAPAEVMSNLIEANIASTAGAGNGGGVFLNYYAVFRDNHINANNGSVGSGLQGAGGGLYMHYAPGVTLDGNRFVHNAATSSGSVTGTGILGKGAGGAIQGYSLVVFTMTNNLVVGNFATGRGGAVYLDGWKAGRGITGTLVNNTLAGNEAPAGSEAIWVSSYVSLSLVNNIVAGHTMGITNAVPANSAVSADRNLFWNQVDPIVGSNAILEDPKFGLGHHLRADSPAVDQGVDVPWLPGDLDGNPRPQGSGYDIGAFEGAEVWQDVYVPLAMKNSPLSMTPILSETFDGSTLTGWTPVTGTWTNPGGYMRGEHTGNAWNMHASTGSNVLYQGTVTLLSGNAVGLAFRSSADGSSSYDVILDAQVGVFKISKRLPYQVLASYPVTVQYNRPYKIEVLARDEMIEASLDGRRLLTAIDGTYASGQLGVILFISTATYDDLAAWEIH